MAAGRFQTPARRQRSRPVKAVAALLCAAAMAAYSCAASLSFASRPSVLCGPRAARRTAASPYGSRLLRASRGGEAPEDSRLPFEKLEVGQKHTGIVKGIYPAYGAIVDIGTRGFLHISCIADGRVDDIGDYLQRNQEVEVWISKIKDGKLGLTMVEGREGRPHPGRPRGVPRHWLQGISRDEWLEGTVTGVQPFGAFVKVSHFGDMAEGLVHKSQLSDAYVENVEDEVQTGQKVKVRVFKYDAKEKKLALSMKQRRNRTGEMPADLLKFEGVSPDQWLTGKVTGKAPYRAFVTVTGEDGSEAVGIVHSVIKHTGMNYQEFEDELQLGREVKVRIVRLDAGAGKMTLRMKPVDSHEK